MPSAPFVVRIAGLSGNALVPLSSPRCLEHLERDKTRLETLDELRKALVKLLEAVLTDYPKQLRRFFLSVKRDCYNARPLRRHIEKTEWERLVEVSGELPGQILDLEEEHRRSKERFALLYEEELAREHAHVSTVLKSPSLLRAIALSSPELVRKARRFADSSPSSFNRKHRKTYLSALRYITRAAAKLSPFSTLTTVGLGMIHGRSGSPNLQFVDCRSQERSLLRINRSLLDRYQTFLLRHPEMRGHCLLSINNTLEKLESQRYRFLRFSHWTFDREVKEFVFLPDRRISVTLEGPLLKCLQDELKHGHMRYATLMQKLANEYRERLGTADVELIRDGVEDFVSMGLVHLLPPWPTHAIHLEKTMYHWLRHHLPDDQALQDVAVALEDLLRLQSSFPVHAQPERCTRALRKAIARLQEELEILADEKVANRPKKLVYEGVFQVAQGPGTSEREVVRVSDPTIRDVLQPAELISQFASLFNHRHDILHTLSAFWRKHWPNRTEVPFLEVFHTFNPIWKDYLRFDFANRHTHSSFNPFDLPCIRDLHELRGTFYENTYDLLVESEEGSILPTDTFEDLTDTIPPRYRSFLGCCVFVQPADREGSRWVLNRLFEGSGRYLTRYSALMESSIRERFRGHFVARSALEIDSEPAHLLDLLFTHSSMTNVRSPQTFRVLEYPGEHVAAPWARKVSLRDLHVRADLVNDQLRLVDERGQRLLPVHLSSSNNLYLPVILRFLSAFGPYEIRQVFPRPEPQMRGEIEVYSRLTCGNLITQRKRWVFPCEMAGDEIRNADGPEGYRRIQQWREKHGLPQQVFLYEQMHKGSKSARSYKPQYLDFSSPSLMAPLLGIINKNTENLIFEEPLPLYTDFPGDPSGAPRAIELQFDSLVLTSPMGSGETVMRNASHFLNDEESEPRIPQERRQNVRGQEEPEWSR